VARGLASVAGATRTAKNGYHYTKVELRGWILTHWLTIEREIGREINPNDETVRFKDGFTKRDYNNPDAIIIVPKNSTNLRRRKAVVEERIRELQAELERIDRELGLG